MHTQSSLATASRPFRVGIPPAAPLREQPFCGMTGQSPQMRSIYAAIQKIAPHYRTVLVTGETGTGKDLAARAIHEYSPAAGGPFVTLNCSAVVETLFESELFGYVRGAFTGAAQDKMGLFEFANGGTLFLDEIGDMPLSTQAKLLRAIQNREILRVGSLAPRKVDLRVIAATNKDLRAAVAAGKFREDLYYRLSMVEIPLPPLRVRSGDLLRLIQSLLRQWSQRLGLPLATLSEGALAMLVMHDWPGNIRELENVLGHAYMMAAGDFISADDLPAYLPRRCAAPVLALQAPAPDTLDTGVAGALEESEIRLIRQALDLAGWNQSHAARVLRTSRDRLRYKMRKYGLMEESGGEVLARRRTAIVA